jgi:hypothetical protein
MLLATRTIVWLLKLADTPFQAGDFALTRRPQIPHFIRVLGNIPRYVYLDIPNATRLKLI